MAMRQVNDKGIELIKAFEGCKLTAYLDASTPPVPTIGWGEIFHTDGSPVKMGETITQQQADDMLAYAIHAEGSHFLDAWVKIPLNDDEYAALTSFIYNAGCGTFRRKVLPLLNAGDKAGAMAAMKTCDTAGGSPLPGLDRRRRAECALFVSDYATMTKEINA